MHSHTHKLTFQLIVLSLLVLLRSSYALEGVIGYPDCYVQNATLIGNGRCDNFEPYNSPECGADGGDCEEFNLNFPGCKAAKTALVGDGKCYNILPYNTTECDFDGGDCDAFRKYYPHCYTVNSEFIGNGMCDISYNTTECGFDGGDCTEEALRKPKDWSDRYVGIGIGSMVCFGMLVGIATYCSKVRRNGLDKRAAVFDRNSSPPAGSPRLYTDTVVPMKKTSVDIDPEEGENPLPVVLAPTTDTFDDIALDGDEEEPETPDAGDEEEEPETPDAGDEEEPETPDAGDEEDPERPDAGDEEEPETAVVAPPADTTIEDIAPTVKASSNISRSSSSSSSIGSMKSADLNV